MNSALRTKLEERLTTLDGLIDAADAAVLESATSGSIATFELDTGEADQKVIFRNLASLNKFRNALNLEYEQILRRLNGRAFTAIKRRRK